MDRSASEDSARTTKMRLLDAAEKLYTQSGQESLSLRDLTELAGVNLAAVNYHFGSKSTLVSAMVSRRLDVINAFRLSELQRMENTLQGSLRCEHILTCLLKGLIQPSFDVVANTQHCDFAIRISTDLSENLRQFLTERYAHVEEAYMAAFCRVTPWLAPADVAWQLNCVAFALPGVGVNANTLQLIRRAAIERNMDRTHILANLASTVTALLQAPAPDSSYLAMIDTVLADVESVPIPA